MFDAFRMPRAEQRSGNIMPDFAREHLGSLGKVDIIVAIPSYRNAGTIAGVAKAAGEALARDFPDLRGLVLNADGDPLDSTPFVFNSAVIPPGVRRDTIPYASSPGLGNALRLIAAAIELTGARYCVVLDPELEEPDPGWVRALAAPLLDGSADLVTPVYQYRPFDDLVNRLLAQPLAARRHSGDWAAPGGRDFAVSARLWLALRDALPNDPATDGAGAALWLSYWALRQGERIVQVGPLPRARYARDPAVPLPADFAQLAATAFDLVGDPLPAPPVVLVTIPGPELEPVEATVAALIARFKRGANTAGALWEQVLSPANLAAVQEIAAGNYRGAAVSEFSFPAALWVGMVDDWRRAYQAEAIGLQQTLTGLGPLFHGFAGAFVAQARGDEEKALRELTALFRAAQ